VAQDRHAIAENVGWNAQVQMPLPDTSARRLTIALFWENQERALHFVLEEGDKVRMGRSPSCDICFESSRMVRKISWFHCEITALRDTKQGLRLCIKDLSSNGTGVSLHGGSVQRLPSAEARDLNDGARIVLPVKASAPSQEALLLRICNSTDSMQDSLELEDVSIVSTHHLHGPPSPPLWVDAADSVESSSSGNEGEPCAPHDFSGTPLWKSLASSSRSDPSSLVDKMAAVFEPPARARLKGGLARQCHLKAWLGGA